MKTCHGGDIYTKKIKYDFSVNTNPLGIPENVKNVLIENVDLFSNYPDVNCTDLKKAISLSENISTEKIVCGNGAADLIYRIVQTLKLKKALLAVPTFSEYEKALHSVNCEIKYFFLNEKKDFKLSDKIYEMLTDIDIFFLCNPNNPTGNIIEPDIVNKIIDRCKENNIYLIIDECFMGFVSEYEKYCTKATDKNVIILKAFTKIYALAGLRLGYAICSDEKLIKKIENCGQCWSVSVAAQVAGTAALKEKNYVKKTVEIIARERLYLISELKKFGFKIYNSYANFLLFKCDIPLDTMLIDEKILIRNCNNYIGLEEGYFRVAVKTHTENEALINAIERVIKNG